MILYDETHAPGPIAGSLDRKARHNPVNVQHVETAFQNVCYQRPLRSRPRGFQRGKDRLAYPIQLMRSTRTGLPVDVDLDYLHHEEKAALHIRSS